MCGPISWVGQRERMSQHSWWLCGNFARIHARDSSKNARKVLQTSPFLCMELTHVCVYLFFFFHPLGCVYCVLCVRKAMWNTPGQIWEKPLDDLMAMSGLGGWDSGDWPPVFCHFISLLIIAPSYCFWIIEETDYLLLVILVLRIKNWNHYSRRTKF